MHVIMRYLLVFPGSISKYSCLLLNAALCSISSGFALFARVNKPHRDRITSSFGNSDM